LPATPLGLLGPLALQTRLLAGQIGLVALQTRLLAGQIGPVADAGVPLPLAPAVPGIQQLLP